VVKKLHKDYNAVTEAQYQSFKVLAQGQLPFIEWSRNWRKTSMECSAFMQQVAKGSLCAICDTKEYVRFSSDMYTDEKTKKKSKIVYVSKYDAHAFSMKCEPHLEQTVLYMSSFKHIQNIMEWISPDKFNRLLLKMPSSEFHAENTQSTLDAMKKCAQNEEMCTSEALLYYMNGPLTRFEMEWWPYLSEVQKIVAHLQKRNWKKARTMYPMVDRRRILLAKVEVVEERDWR
jgi:hypothetical protein